MPLTWKDRVKVSIASGGTGTLTLNAAASGYQTFAAGDDGLLFPYVIVNGTAWETGYGTYTHSGTTFARTSRTASSSGSAIDAGTGDLYVDLISTNASHHDLAAQAINPGGRLTLTSGTPVTSADVTGATNVYYTPYVHNCITLWDGNIWKTITFTEVTEALGTLTAALPYDVFGFLSSGALDLEKLAWTNTTTRATDITLQDGRYCKSGDKTRLYLGTFYTTATTTTEDSGGGSTTQVGGKRFLWNMYNRVGRDLKVIDTTNTWSYSTDTTRQANGATGNKVEFVIGVADTPVQATNVSNFYNASASTRVGRGGVGLDTTSAFSGLVGSGNQTGAGGQYMTFGGSYRGYPAVGYHYISWNERGADGTSTWIGDNGADGTQSGLTAMVMA